MQKLFPKKIGGHISLIVFINWCFLDLGHHVLINLDPKNMTSQLSRKQNLKKALQTTKSTGGQGGDNSLVTKPSLLTETQIYPPKVLTWNLKMAPWNRRFLLETIIFKFNVKLGEGGQGGHGGCPSHSKQIPPISSFKSIPSDPASNPSHPSCLP